MAKAFNTFAACLPDEHYMVNIDERLEEIKTLVDDGKYITINRARQYGKTTTLRALRRYLQKDYYVVLMDFQVLGSAKFKNENTFSIMFAKFFLRSFKQNRFTNSEIFAETISEMEYVVKKKETGYELNELFDHLIAICETSDRPVVLLIDETDKASNNQIFLDFLSQLRAYYIDRDLQPTFHSVILAGLYDVRNLRLKLRPEEDHKVNSPWNIAVGFKMDMSLSKEGIAGMLKEYEEDHSTGMNVEKIAELLYIQTSGYPFLVSRLCQILDEEIVESEKFPDKASVWTETGVNEAVKMILSESNNLFGSLTEKLMRYPELNSMLKLILFTGKPIAYNNYEQFINIATMFGFVKDNNGTLVIANRIFETWLYNYYLSEADMQQTDIYKASQLDKNQFIIDGHLDMKRILEKFVEHFHDLYGEKPDNFIEDEGRLYFLLYLRPIINGTGNYYIESRTRDLRRTDVIVDYHGEQYVIELKIWHGQEYNTRGENQLVGYMDDYHTKKGYMLSFNFNKKKEIGVKEIVIGDKLLIEAIV